MALNKFHALYYILVDGKSLDGPCGNHKIFFMNANILSKATLLVSACCHFITSVLLQQSVPMQP